VRLLVSNAGKESVRNGIGLSGSVFICVHLWFSGFCSSTSGQAAALGRLPEGFGKTNLLAAVESAACYVCSRHLLPDY
jgi:hypothetical protein